jgi:hypothetical protein
MAEKSYKEKARLLKRAGLMKIDLRETPSPLQKAAITKTFNKHKSVLNNLQDFTIRTVSKATSKNIDTAALKIKTKNGKEKLFIPTPHGEKVRIKKGRLNLDTKNYHEEVYPGGWNFFDNAKKVFKKKLGKNEYITVRIGTNSAFNRTFKDINSLLFYMRDWNPKDALETKENLISHISIVKVKDESQTVYKGGGNGKKKPKSKTGRY